ncbi:MAG: HIT domain-containing protein [Planctomycetes bacterium]|nr:HIT domain-containing protein [Planctomycetota bacterium]
MRQLWAPWRIEYIREAGEPGCVFCRLLAENRDDANLIVVRRARTFALLNRYPYNSGHLMVAPLAHKGDLAALDDAETLELMRLLAEMQALLMRVMQPQGFNLGVNLGRVAGAGVLEHIHLHLVPRWNGDTNFMPVLDDVRVIPQALSELHALLVKALRESAATTA